MLERVAGRLVGPILALTILTSGLVASHVTAEPVATRDGASPIDLLLADSAVVASMRIGIVFLMGYVVCSILAGMADRRYLTEVGPVKTDTTISMSALNDERDRLRQEVSEAHETIEVLAAELRACEIMIDDLQDSGYTKG